ncbi:putative glycosyltransferase EpsE [Pedobacter glucosidilyticus]|nr:glycosyltransferase [Pedobacter glucosidilyticus]KHJ39625.1 putative glycosyltransferase EpsE [Pedobacter glucosidilyticus]
MDIISVVMSVYNAEKFLKESIESILNQTYQNFEFIIINDGSSDGSLSIIQSYNDDRIILIDQENQGLSKSLNNGIRNAKGEFIARMDADDISINNRLELQLSFLKKNPKCVLVGANTNLIDEQGNYLYSSSLPLSWEEIKKKLPDSYIFHSLAFFRKKTYLEAGGYNESIIHHFEDKILWNEMAKYGELRNLPDILLNYRWVPNSISNLPHKQLSQMKIIADKIILKKIVSHEDILNIKILSTCSRREKKGNYYLRLSNVHLHYGRRNLAIKYILICLKYIPENKKVWLNILLFMMPVYVIKNLKRLNNYLYESKKIPN